MNTHEKYDRLGPILFYGMHGQYPEFSNFHQAEIEIGGRTYATVEHFFQAAKAVGKRDHERIRCAPTPMRAKQLGRAVELRRDWENVKVDIMYRALLAKFSQHEDLKALLLSTGDRVIHEDAPNDATWGWMNGSGKDLLGKLLMKTRTALRKADAP